MVGVMQSTTSQHKKRQPSEELSPLPSPAGPASGTKGKGSGSSITVLDMIEAGLLQPGESNTTVTYKGTIHTASLQQNGTIKFRGGCLVEATCCCWMTASRGPLACSACNTVCNCQVNWSGQLVFG